MYSNVKSIFLPYSANYINRVNMAGKLLSVNAISLDVHEERPACRWSWHLSPPLPVVIFNSGCPRFWLMLNLFFEESCRKIWSKRKSSYLCSPIGNALVSRTRELSSVGSERLPYKQRVGGSTPSAPTSMDSEILRVLFLFPVILGFCFPVILRVLRDINRTN